MTAPLIAGTASLIILEGGGEIYHQWALSGFMFEIADHLTDQQIATYRVTAPRQLDQLLSGRPPPAIITRENRSDRLLADYARAHGYQPVEYPQLAVRLWKRPRS